METYPAPMQSANRTLIYVRYLIYYFEVNVNE